MSKFALIPFCVIGAVMFAKFSKDEYKAGHRVGSALMGMISLISLVNIGYMIVA